MIDDAEVTARTHVIARRLREDEGAATAAVTDEILARIRGLDEDPVLVDMLDASVHGNVTTIIHMLANDIAIDRLQPTTAAVEYARRLAQRDVPANSLVRAYHVGQSVLLRDVYAKVDELALSTTDSMQVVRHVTDIVYEYIDWITKYVFEAYEDERRRWMGVESNVLTSTIHALLASSTPDPTHLERESRYRLDQRHCALILWSSDEDEVTVRELDRTARALAVRLRSDGEPLVTAIDRQTVWAWLPLGRRGRQLDGPDLESALDPAGHVRVAHGTPADGVDGFRRSHQQAQAAFTVATVSPDRRARHVVGYRDRGVGLVALLARDVDSTRAWVRDVLGSLAADGDAAAILRDTLGAYFATGDSHLRAAQRLNVHRNTVKYRVTKALADAPASDRLDIATALAVCDLLGPAVIGDTAP
ncbi:ABC transporter substrate-binding protein [Gordonia spumicola]|uniref:ABC transporter substrate-binding protein n=1 Tax=Gordonia spumicola TaxID=589161 RepID=A0A7I9VD53_9ACTN|nr:helix-turn-helix domain-containing protein [Gordonia spumicola]GEE03237.1 ABC transporter substrate-binding protein [Gordonia spumicola]